MATARCMRNLYVVCCLSVLAACSNGRGSLDSEPAPPSGGAQEGFTVGGTISGLDGNGLVLQNNGGNDLAVSNNGIFTFTGGLANAAAYNVTVLTQPSGPSQTCTVGNGSGTIASGNVANIAVTCATGTFVIGGSVSGLVGSGLELQNNGGDDLRIGGNGTFQFGTLLTSGASYNVTVAEDPSNPTQSCAVTNASGSVGNTSVTNIAVNCMTDMFTVGGRVTGLRGSGLVLQLNDAANLTLNRDPKGGNVVDFAFSTLLSSGAPYQVTVIAQPTTPSQTCQVTPTTARGTIGSDNVRSVRVTCSINSFSIGGTVSGLRGRGLELQTSGGDELAIASDGRFTFETKQESDTQYEVKVKKQPTDPSQECTVANATGTVGSGDIRDVHVTCSTNTFTIGGTVSGLLGSGLQLQNNGGAALTINADGSFVFGERIASGADYEVTVLTHPSNPTQACSIVNGTGSGTVADANITSVAISCSTSNFTIGGTVQGLAGSNLVLQNNGTDDLILNSGSSSFTFATAVPSGSSYNVTIAAQPTGPAQECIVTNPSGAVSNDNVTSVAINCTTTEFSVGGSVTGLTGTGLVLQNNGGDNLAIAASTSFTFPTSLPNGALYNVTVATQPSSPAQTCLVTNGIGAILGADVTAVQVDCTDDPLP